MVSNDKKNQDCGEHAKLTSGDLSNILEVNKKAIEIHVSVERQQEDIIEYLEHIKQKVDDIDKNLFKLIIILTTIGVGTVFQIIALFVGHK